MVGGQANPCIHIFKGVAAGPRAGSMACVLHVYITRYGAVFVLYLVPNLFLLEGDYCTMLPVLQTVRYCVQTKQADTSTSLPQYEICRTDVYRQTVKCITTWMDGTQSAMPPSQFENHSDDTVVGAGGN